MTKIELDANALLANAADCPEDSPLMASIVDEDGEVLGCVIVALEPALAIVLAEEVDLFLEAEVDDGSLA